MLVRRKMSSLINFFFEDVHNIRLSEKRLLREWIKRVLGVHLVQLGSINIILTSDETLFKINRKYLKHNTLTDTITFSYSENEALVTGDIFISLPRIKENAIIYGVTFRNELYRVIIHGILHLLRFDDFGEEGKKEMHTLENKYLDWLEEMKKNRSTKNVSREK